MGHRLRLARTAADSDLTMTGDLVGTLRYMSPEQSLAKHGLVDHRTDVYSLGVTLYELLTMQPSIGGKDRQEILHNIAFEEPCPPRRLNAAVPADLETVLLKAMAKEPAERYATARELAEDLGRFVREEPIRARRPSLLQLLRQWARRRKAVVWSAAAALVVVIAVLAGSAGWILGDRAARQAEAAGRGGTEGARGAGRSTAGSAVRQPLWPRPGHGSSQGRGAACRRTDP
jgi:hypothetical protein